MGSVGALVLGTVDRTGDLVLWLARLWARVILGVPGVKLDVTMRTRLEPDRDRKSTRLNSSHTVISYAVFCLKKKNTMSDYRSGAKTSRITGGMVRAMR